MESSLPAGCVCVCVGGCGRGKSSSSIEGKDNDVLRAGSWIGIELAVVAVLVSFWAAIPAVAAVTGVSQHSSEGGEIAEKLSDEQRRDEQSRGEQWYKVERSARMRE